MLNLSREYVTATGRSKIKVAGTNGPIGPGGSWIDISALSISSGETTRTERTDGESRVETFRYAVEIGEWVWTKEQGELDGFYDSKREFLVELATEVLDFCGFIGAEAIAKRLIVEDDQ